MNLVISITELLLSQVNLLLDKNMLENDSYSTLWSLKPIKKTVSDVVKILQS